VALCTWRPDSGFLRQLRDGRCVLFAGAGLSAAAGLPGWKGLLRKIAESAIDVPHERRDELGALLDSEQLLHAASLLREAMGADAFNAALANALGGCEPSPLHLQLRRIPWRLIVTTNFDDLIERTFPDWPSVTHRDAHEIARLLSDGQPFILKAHGDVHRPETIVLGRGDFAKMVWGREDFQRTMSAILLTSPVIFAGYSHADEDFDLLMLEHVELFGTEGARRYAFMRVNTAAERAQIDILRRKAIQLLAYREHDDVPAALESLAGLLADRSDDTLAAPSRPPPLGLGVGKPLRHTSAKDVDGRPRVIVIPGLMGSRLEAYAGPGKRRGIWLDFIGLVRGRFAELDLSGSAAHAPRIHATDLLDNLYGRLFETLAGSHALVPFAYDWRLSFRESADALARVLEREAPSNMPCHIVAHGEGGLVARVFAAEHPDLWRSLRCGVGRIVCLGTPWHGTFEALRLLLGSNPMQTKLALLDLAHGLREIQAAFASFPSIYELLPSPLRDAAWLALYRRESYQDAPVDPTLLEQGRMFHDYLASLAVPGELVNVLGNAPATIDAVEDPTRLDRHSRWTATSRGDGTVAYASSLTGGAEPYYAACERGGLAADAEVIDAIVDLLRTGATQRLPREPLVTR